MLTLPYGLVSAHDWSRLQDTFSLPRSPRVTVRSADERFSLTADYTLRRDIPSSPDLWAVEIEWTSSPAKLDRGARYSSSFPLAAVEDGLSVLLDDVLEATLAAPVVQDFFQQVLELIVEPYFLSVVQENRNPLFGAQAQRRFRKLARAARRV